MDPYGSPDLAALNRELAAMSMSIPADVAAALQEEQRRHLAGELGESREAVAERRRIVRALIFHEYLIDVHSLVSRPRR
jgi:hypothetical protein